MFQDQCKPIFAICIAQLVYKLSHFHHKQQHKTDVFLWEWSMLSEPKEPTEVQVCYWMKSSFLWNPLLLNIYRNTRWLDVTFWSFNRHNLFYDRIFAFILVYKLLMYIISDHMAVTLGHVMLQVVATKILHIEDYYNYKVWFC